MAARGRNAMDPDPSPDAPTRLLANRDFTRYLIGRVGFGLGQQMILVGIGWYVYELTNSALALGFVGLAMFLPTISLSLVTGHIADTFDRARVIALSYGVIAVVAAGLTLVAATGLGDVHLIYALLALLGTARAFANPAGQALVPSLVPRAQFSRAIAFSSSSVQFTVAVGPMVGGLLYALGPVVVFGVAAAILAAGAVTVSGIRHRSDSGIARERPSLAVLMAGLSFIRSRPAILGAISLDLFAVLLGGAVSLMPIIARDVLHTGPWGLGLLRSGPAIGAVLVGLYLARFPIRRHAGVVMFGAVALFGLMTVGFGLSASLPLSVACLICMGAADMVSVFIRQTLVQLETPDALRGRVAAVNTVFIGASNELGDFESGLVAAAIGAVPAIVVGGLGTMAVAGLWALAFPDLRKRDTLG